MNLAENHRLAAAGEIAREPDVVTIDASSSRDRISFPEIWHHRELLSLFIRRHLSSRYRQMALGSLWAVLEPLAQLVLLSVVFGLILRVNTSGYPYPVYAFSGLIPWWLFSRTTMSVAGCLQDNMGLISKVYFPRILLALAAAARDLVDSLVAFVLLLAVAALYGFFPSPRLLLVPAIMLVVSIAAMSIGLWVAALMVKFRDVRPALAVILQAGMFLTPILYSADLVPQKFRLLYELNPMYWGVETFRWMLLDKTFAVTGMLGMSLFFVALTLFLGLKVFSLQERLTVDVQ